MQRVLDKTCNLPIIVLQKHRHTLLTIQVLLQQVMVSELCSSALQGSQLMIRLSFYLLTLIDDHANISVKSLPKYQQLVHISVHKCITKQAGA